MVRILKRRRMKEAFCHGGAIAQEPPGDKTMIDPAEGALDLSGSRDGLGSFLSVMVITSLWG